jgi:hypothetical protein
MDESGWRSPATMSRVGTGIEFLRAMIGRFRSRRSLHPRWTTGGVRTLLGAASDATAAVLSDGVTASERALEAVDAANYLVLLWMHCFGWRLYLGGTQFGPEAGVALFGVKYLEAVSKFRGVPRIGDVPHELERLSRVASAPGREAEVERTAVSCIAALAEVYQATRESEHPLVVGRVRAVVEHVLRCAECRERYGGGAEVALELLQMELAARAAEPES